MNWEPRGCRVSSTTTRLVMVLRRRDSGRCLASCWCQGQLWKDLRYPKGIFPGVGVFGSACLMGCGDSFCSAMTELDDSWIILTQRAQSFHSARQRKRLQKPEKKHNKTTKTEQGQRHGFHHGSIWVHRAHYSTSAFSARDSGTGSGGMLVFRLVSIGSCSDGRGLLQRCFVFLS